MSDAPLSSQTPPPPPSSSKALGAIIGAALVVVLAVTAVMGDGEPTPSPPQAPVAPADTVTITSTPSGATIYVGSRPIGETPMDVTLPEDMPEYQVVLRSLGHRDQSLALRRGRAAHAVLAPMQPAKRSPPSTGTDRP